MDLTEYFGFDRHMRTLFGPYMGPLPRSSLKIVSDDGENVVVVAELGAKYRVRKRMASIPQYLKFPIENWKDWERIKARYDPSTPCRYPKYWDKVVRVLKKRDYPICVRYVGFWYAPGDPMGTINLCKALYTKPELV